VSTIRPPIFPTVNTPAQGAQTTRNAGQRAFFEAAMGRTAEPASPRPTEAGRAPIQKIPTNLPADPPEKILRPGSLLDIRV
jgi:hypothetical protein